MPVVIWKLKQHQSNKISNVFLLTFVFADTVHCRNKKLNFKSYINKQETADFNNRYLWIDHKHPNDTAGNLEVVIPQIPISFLNIHTRSQ
jgi:hypothetical protein